MNKERKKVKFEVSTTLIIALSFLATILIGSLLLMLPISSADGTPAPFLTSLFTATTSVCVTGLVVENTFEYFSTFGHVIILILIQIGGLGIITFSTSVMMIFHQKVSLKDRLLLQDAFNLSTMSGLVRFVRKIILGTFLVESFGAFLYCFTFIPEFGFKNGLWISVFNSISAFCNAGIDIIGPNSLAPYITNINVNITTMFLIFMGSLGFIVWFDIANVLKAIKNKTIHRTYFWKSLNLHTKIVLTTTFSLIIGGAILILALEYTNNETIGNLSLGHKIVASFFESVTTRTAGFLTFSQKAMRDSTALICLILMFIGGSPVGTAGGVKTTTFALVIISALSVIKGEEHGIAFNRRLPTKTMRKALAVILISLLASFTAIILLLTFCGGDLIDIMFEVISAICTVGLTRDFTATLNTFGRIIIIITMYLGRIGPISLALIFSSKESKHGLATFPKEDITVG